MMLWTGNDDRGLLLDVLAENSYLDEKKNCEALTAETEQPPFQRL